MTGSIYDPLRRCPIHSQASARLRANSISRDIPDGHPRQWDYTALAGGWNDPEPEPNAEGWEDGWADDVADDDGAASAGVPASDGMLPSNDEVPHPAPAATI